MACPLCVQEKAWSKASVIAAGECNPPSKVHIKVIYGIHTYSLFYRYYVARSVRIGKILIQRDEETHKPKVRP